MTDTAGRERRAAARFTEIVMQSLFTDSGDEYVTELLQESLHYVRQEFGDDIELFDLMHTPTDAASAAAGSLTISVAGAINIQRAMKHHGLVSGELDAAIRAAAESAEASGEEAE